MEIGEIFPQAGLSEDFLFAEILPKLPLKTLMRFKCVSKSWSTRISGGDSYFIAAHRNRHRGDRQAIFLGDYIYDQGTYGLQGITLLSDQGLKATEVDVSYINARRGDIAIVGSCDGLICLIKHLPGVSDALHASILLWNPATRQLRKLPNAPRDYSWIYGFGFGFDGASKEYKVVKLVHKWLKGPLMSAQVFSRSDNIWRGGEEEQGFRTPTTVLATKSAVEASGALYWLAYDLSRPMRIHVIARFILHFDLSDEVLSVADVPGDEDCYSVHISRWRDSLTAFTYRPGCVMWVATPVGSGLRWTKLYNITSFGRELFRGVWRDECLVVRSTRREMELWLHDPKVAGHGKRLKLPGFCWKMSNPCVYVESIVSVY